MDDLSVTPSALRSCADSLESAAKSIVLELETLHSALEHLSAEWSGEAHHAFDVAQARARADFDLLRQALVTIAAQVRATAEGYADTDRTAARALGGQ